jgi:exodeoxyribonuclease VII small subunit
LRPWRADYTQVLLFRAYLFRALGPHRRAGQGKIRAMSKKLSPAGDLPDDSSNSAPSFEQSIGRLEHIVRQMEDGSLTLEQSLAAYKEGAELIASCRIALDNVEQQVKILEAGVLKPFVGDDNA